MDTGRCHIMHNHELLAWQVQALKKRIENKSTSLMGNLDAAAASLLGSSAWLSKPLMSPSAGRKIATSLMETQADVAWLTNHLHRLLLSHAAILEASTSSPSVSAFLVPPAESLRTLGTLPALHLASVGCTSSAGQGDSLQALTRTAQGDVSVQPMQAWEQLVQLSTAAVDAEASSAAVVHLQRALAAGYVPGLGFPRILRGVQHRILHAACTRSLVWAVNARGHVLAAVRETGSAETAKHRIGPVRAAELHEDRAVKVVATSSHCIALGKDGGVFAAACNSVFRQGMQSSLPVWQPHFHQLQSADLVTTAPVAARDIVACTLPQSSALAPNDSLSVVCALPSAFSPHAGAGLYIAGYVPPAPGSSQGIKPHSEQEGARSGAPSPLIPARSRARTSALSGLQLPDTDSRSAAAASSAPQSSPLRDAVHPKAHSDEACGDDVTQGAAAPSLPPRAPWQLQLAAVVATDTDRTESAEGSQSKSATWFTRMWMCASTGALVLCDNSHLLWYIAPHAVRDAAADSMKLSAQREPQAISRSRTGSTNSAASGLSDSSAAARLVLPARRLRCPTPPWGLPATPLSRLLPDAAKWPAYNSVAVLGDTVAASSACGCAFVWQGTRGFEPTCVANGPAASTNSTLPVQQVSLLSTHVPTLLLHHQRFALHDALPAQVCMAPYAAQAAAVRISVSGHPSPSLSSVDTPRQRLRAFRGSPPEFGLDSPSVSPGGSPTLQPAAPRLRSWRDINVALHHVLKALQASPAPRQGTKASNQVIALVRAARALLRDGVPLASDQRGDTWGAFLSLYAHVPWLWRPMSRKVRSRAGTGSTEDGSLPPPPPPDSAGAPLARARTDSTSALEQALSAEVVCPPQDIDAAQFAALLRAAESQTSDPMSSLSARSLSSQQRSSSLSARRSDLSLLTTEASGASQLQELDTTQGGQDSDEGGVQGHAPRLAAAAATYSTMLMIERDVCRTMSGSGIFDDAACPLHEELRAVLLAFAAWDPVTAYPQGLSYLASVCCLLQSGRPAALRMLAVLTRQPCVLSLLRADVQVLRWHCSVFEHALARAMPDLAAHLQAENFEVQFALLPWFSTLFLRCLPPQLALPGIDMFVLGGTRALYCVALALFRLLRPALMHASFELLTRILTVNAMQIAHVVGGSAPPRTRWEADPEPSEANALADPALLTTAAALAEASDFESHVLVPHAMGDVEAAWAAVKPATLAKAAHAETLPSYVKHAIQVVDAGSDPSSVLTALSGAAGSAAGIDSSTLAAETSVTSMWSLMYGGGARSAASSAPVSPAK